MSSPSDSRSPAASGVIHDIGYRPYAGPRLGEGSVAWAFFVTGLRNAELIVENTKVVYRTGDHAGMSLVDLSIVTSEGRFRH